MRATFSQDAYQRAIAFAATAHGDQRIPGSGLPYVVHLSNVAMEVVAAAELDPFDVDFAVTCALLHDTLEDTETTDEEIERNFGARVRLGVRALAKNQALAKDARMSDSLARILEQPREVAIVKLADRITNLQPPPAHWSREKCLAYCEEARAIHAALGGACAPLARRLSEKIEAYAKLVSLGR